MADETKEKKKEVIYERKKTRKCLRQLIGNRKSFTGKIKLKISKLYPQREILREGKAAKP